VKEAVDGGRESSAISTSASRLEALQAQFTPQTPSEPREQLLSIFSEPNRPVTTHRDGYADLIQCDAVTIHSRGVRERKRQRLQDEPEVHRFGIDECRAVALRSLGRARRATFPTAVKPATEPHPIV
jgi:hypothetical protein